jgi:hypothetical protein
MREGVYEALKEMRDDIDLERLINEQNEEV